MIRLIVHPYILKIRYLKNKRQIGDLHIDHINGKLLPCTEEESKLLTKYKPFLYYHPNQNTQI